MLRNSVLVRIARTLPEVWVALALGIVHWWMLRRVPPELTRPLGWEIHPYQVLAVLTALVLFTLPGALLMRLLRVGGAWPTRLPTYFAAAVGLWSIPGLFVAFTARFSLVVLVALGALLTVGLGIATVLREILSPAATQDAGDEGRKDLSEPVQLSLLALGIMTLLAMTWISLHAPISLDDNLQLAYVQDNLVVEHINAEEPVFGAGVRPSTRGSLTTWPLNLAVMSYLSGLSAQQAFWLLRTPLALLGVLSIYALALRLLGDRQQAIFAAIFYCMLAVIMTTEPDAIGFGLFSRAAQDKFVVRNILFPMTLSWSLAYLGTPSRRSYWLTGAATIGLASTHPIGMILLGICLGSLGLVHAAVNLRRPPGRALAGAGNALARLWILGREWVVVNWPMLRPYVFLAVLPLAGVALPAFQKASPDAPLVAYSLTDTVDPSLLYRINLVVNNYRLWIANYLGPRAYIVHPRVFITPIILVPALGLPVLFRRLRGQLFGELAIGTYLINPIILLVPPLVQFIGDRATPWLLYRFAWPLSLLGPILIAWAAWGTIQRLAPRLSSPVVRSLLPIGVLVAGAVLLSTEIRLGLTSLKELREDPVAGRCRSLQPILSRLPELVGEGTVVLSTPDMNMCIPTSAARAYPVEYFLTSTLNRFPQSRLPEGQQRIDDVHSFIVSQVVDRQLLDVLARWNVGLILLRSDHALVSQLRHLPGYFQVEASLDRYLIMRVLPHVRSECPPSIARTNCWQVVRWEGTDPLVSANSLWRDGDWEDAIKAYQAVLGTGAMTDFLAHAGLGGALLSGARLEDAIAAYQAAVRDDPSDEQAWVLLGDALWLARDYAGMVSAENRALEQVDWHPKALRRLGDAYRMMDQKDRALAAYARYASVESAQGSSLYFQRLGSVYLSANWIEDAIAAFHESLRIREDLLALTQLSEAYRRQGDPELAWAKARRAHRVEYWSDLPYLEMAALMADQGDIDGVFDNLRRAVTRNPQSAAIANQATTRRLTAGQPAALDEIRRLVGFKLGFSKAVLAAARLELELGSIRPALASALQAWQWEPVLDQAAVLIGDVYRILGQEDQARQYYRNAITVAQFNSAGYLGLAAQAQWLGDRETATGWTWAAVTASPNESAPIIAMGRLHESDGDLIAADETYRRAVDADPYDSAPYVALAGLQVRRGELRAAAEGFQKALSLQHAATPAYRGLGTVYSALGQIPEALATLREGVTAYPGDGINQVELAGLLMQQGEQDEAIQRLIAARELAPGEQRVHQALAAAYLALGRMDDAESVFSELVQTLPDFDAGYAGLGRIQERRGDQAAAAEYFELAGRKAVAGGSASADLALADLRLRQGQPDQALLLHQSVIDRYPMLPDGYVAMSQLFSRQGNWGSAEQVLERGLGLMPGSSELILALGQLHISTGRIDLAISTYEKSTQASPSALVLPVALAELQAAIGEPEQAMEQVGRAVGGWPGSTLLLQRGARLALAIGRPDTAVEWAARLEALAPGSPSTWISSGQVAAGTGQFPRAEAALRQAIQVAPGDAQAWLSLGQFLAQRGQTEEALSAMDAAISLDRSDPAPRLLRARILDHQGQTELARQEYEAALAADASWVSPLLALGDLNRRQGGPTAAAQLFDRAIALAPADPAAHQARALLFLQQGQLQDALGQLVAATQQASGSCQAYLNLAVFLAEHGDPPEAEAAYRQALAGAGCIAQAYLGLGTLQNSLANADTASSEFEKAIQQEPGNPWGYLALANSLAGQSRWELAESTLAEGMQSIPASALLHVAMARNLTSQGLLGSALQEAEEAVGLSPASALALISLGRIQQTQGDFEAAEHSYLSAAQADATNAVARIRLSRLYEYLARFSEAEEAYRQATASFPADSRTFVAYGDFLWARGRTEEAIAVYLMGRSADQGALGPLLSLGEIFRLASRFEDAEQAYQLALTLASSDIDPLVQLEEALLASEPSASAAQVYVGLGDLYRRQSRWGEAEQTYQRAIDSRPGDPSGYLGLGFALMALGRADEAQLQFEAGIANSQTSALLRVALGDLFRLRGRLAEAEQAYVSAYQALPGLADAHVRLGELYLLEGRNQEAFSQFAVAAQIAPAQASAHVALGDWNRLQANLQAAEEAYRQATSIAPANPRGFLRLGDLSHTTGRRLEAFDFYEAAASLAPMSGAAHIALGDWLQIGGNLDAAEAEYGLGTQVASEAVAAFLKLGEVLQLQGRPSAAMEQFQSALSLNPTSPPARVALAEWFTSSADADAAAVQEAYRTAISSASNEVLEYIRAGLDLQSKGETEQAFEQFELAVQADPESVLPYLAMGQWYRLEPGLSSAEQALTTSIATWPGYIDSYTSLAELYASEGRMLDARGVVEDALELAPGAWAVHIMLGDLQWQMGDLEAAEATYEQAIRIAPGVVIVYVRLGSLYEAQGYQERAIAQYEAALSAGLLPEVTICGPGSLPADPASAQQPGVTPERAAELNAWRCSWELRPWATAGEVEAVGEIP